MKWLTNIGNPLTTFINDSDLNRFLRDKYIGDPKASNIYSVEQLQAMDLVGVYDLEENETPTLPSYREFMLNLPLLERYFK